MWEPVQIRHRSAYYDAFFTEALLSFLETGLATKGEADAAHGAIADMVDFCLKVSAEEVPSHDGSTVKVITALAPPPHPRHPPGDPGERHRRARQWHVQHLVRARALCWPI